MVGIAVETIVPSIALINVAMNKAIEMINTLFDCFLILVTSKIKTIYLYQSTNKSFLTLNILFKEIL
ncbi:hypothetical protein AP1H75_09610 [Apilactobacillus apinorum]